VHVLFNVVRPSLVLGQQYRGNLGWHFDLVHDGPEPHEPLVGATSEQSHRVSLRKQRSQTMMSGPNVRPWCP
jgi:hypothetical protein